jgi:hypothetical protein
MFEKYEILVTAALLLVVSGVRVQADLGDAADRTVEAGDLGNIMGLMPYTTTTPSRPFYVFHGIPYAEPTGGTDRFKVRALTFS